MASSPELSERMMPLGKLVDDQEAIKKTRKFAQEERVACEVLGKEFFLGSLICVNQGRVRVVDLE